jgi:hypothetical protein
MRNLNYITEDEHLLSKETWAKLLLIEKQLTELDWPTHSGGVIHYLREFTDNEGGNDGLGITGTYLAICLSKDMPWVAVVTATEAFTNAFYNAKTSPEQISDDMVWRTINDFASQLEHKNYLLQFAFLFTFSARNWATSAINAGYLFQQAGEAYYKSDNFENSFSSHTEAANSFESCNENEEAINEHKMAANALLSLKEDDKYLRAYKSYRKARGIANGVLDYESASKLYMSEREMIELDYKAKIKGSLSKSNIFNVWQYIMLLVMRITSGNFERPQRVAATSFCIILFFSILYLPQLKIAEFKGFPANQDLLNSIVSSVHVSIITFATVGYGNIYPTNIAAMSFTAIEALSGLLFTGLFLFCLSRLSGPR